MIRGAHILITGGTGSFGHRVAARSQELAPASITIFSRDEKKQYEMRKRYPHFRYLLGDVRDADRVNEALRGIDIVFHAAALKQVPGCEKWPEEAIKTNTLGALNVCRAAVLNGVQHVIALSTDKAVKPVNVMGMTKALMERIVCGYSRKTTGTIFCCVRYGNVMGSRGSVIPLFREQIACGEPVTVTVLHMTRFLLTLDQAISLVFYTMEQAKGGEIFVRKAPACRVDLLAQAMIRKYGQGRDIPIVVIGMRVGEKIHEVLVNEYEMLRAVDAGDFYIIPEVEDGLVVDDGKLEATEYTSANTEQITDYETLSRLLDLVDYEEIG
jgi:FlaA1/EpsC-like NDP-sugar epimerase